MPGDDHCPVCGLPRSLNRKLVWTTDEVSTSKPGIRTD